MSVQTVIDTLNGMIKDKRSVLADSLESRKVASSGELVGLDVTINLLQASIGELERIRTGLAACAEKEIEDSWRLNPDRMGQ